MNYIVFYKCETPTHVGNGNELGIIDMPIQREVHTNFPVFESSGIKGVFRDKCTSDENSQNVAKWFGTANEDDLQHEERRAGEIQFTDAKILLFPVKTKKGIFAWITCPFVIKRLMEDKKIFSNKNNGNSTGEKQNDSDKKISDEDVEGIINKVKDDNSIVVSKENNICDKYNDREQLFLEEFMFSCDNNAKNIHKEALDDCIKYFYNGFGGSSCVSEKMLKDIVIVSDNIFKYFVEMSTEVNTRIRLKDGVVEDGALFTEEYLPKETIMYGFINNKKGSIPMYEYIQLGGNETLGKGIVSLHFGEMEE